MPQIYRRHSEYVLGPPTESRLRSTAAPVPTPQLTDADDSIVLSDLVRTGEASRLRRRGAMRLEHGAPRPLFTGGPPALLGTGPRDAPLPRPSAVSPSRAASPPWTFTRYGAPVSGDDGDRFSFSLGSESWRPAEWVVEDPPSEVYPTQPGADEDRREYQHEEQAETEQEYVLLCGGEDTSLVGKEYVEPFRPSALPILPNKTPSTSASSADLCTRRSNGCGAVVHMRAIPQRRRGVWQGAAHAAPTDAVVSLDSSYFDRGVVARMLRSACGCVREGIGCAVCGNILGTRYLPCPAASEGIFSAPNSSATTSSAIQPRHPSGPSYWDPRLPCTSRSRRSNNFFVYTFFADHVSSQPPVEFEFKPSSPVPLPPRREPRREQERMPDILVVPSPSLPVFAPLPNDDRQAEADQGWYGFRTTASPRPFTYSDSVTDILDSPVVSTVPLPLTAVEDTDNGAPYDRLGGMLDADGVLLDPEALSEDRAGSAAHGSADNDKSVGESMMLSGR